MVYCAYQVELKREKLSIMVNMMADERTCTEGAVQIRNWQCVYVWCKSTPHRYVKLNQVTLRSACRDRRYFRKLAQSVRAAAL